MKTSLVYRAGRGALIAGLAVLVAGCVYDNYGGGPVYHREDPYLYDYYYYPSVGVYYHLYSGYYYWHDHHHWYRSRKLPPRYRLDPRDRHRLRDRDDRPYLKHEDHRQSYKPLPFYEPDQDRDRSERQRLREESPRGSRGFDGSAVEDAPQREAPVREPAGRPRGFGG